MGTVMRLICACIRIVTCEARVRSPTLPTRGGGPEPWSVVSGAGHRRRAAKLHAWSVGIPDGIGRRDTLRRAAGEHGARLEASVVATRGRTRGLIGSKPQGHVRAER